MLVYYCNRDAGHEGRCSFDMTDDLIRRDELRRTIELLSDVTRVQHVPWVAIDLLKRRVDELGGGE